MWRRHEPRPSRLNILLQELEEEGEDSFFQTVVAQLTADMMGLLPFVIKL